MLWELGGEGGNQGGLCGGEETSDVALAGSGRAGGRFQVQRLEAERSGGASWSRDLLSAAPLAPVVCFYVSFGDDRFCKQGFQLFIRGHPRPGAPTPRCTGCEALIKEAAEARDPSTGAGGTRRPQ